MKLSKLALVLLLATPAFAQEPKLTTMHGFQLGATWAQCEPLVSKMKAAEVANEVAHEATYHFGSDHVAKSYKTDAAKAAAGELVEIIVRDYMGYYLMFRGGILVQTRVSFNQDTIDYTKFLAEATAKYGKPAAQKTETVQNGYGARWELHAAAWDPQPDGCVVTLIEDVTPERGLYSTLTVRTADEQKRHHVEEKPVL